MADDGSDLIGRLVYLPERSVLEPLVVERTLPDGRVEARALEESEDLFLDRDERVELDVELARKHATVTVEEAVRLRGGQPRNQSENL
jgi:hypothetical protein